MPIKMYDFLSKKDRLVYGFVYIQHEVCAVVYEHVFNGVEMITIPAKYLMPVE